MDEFTLWATLSENQGCAEQDPALNYTVSHSLCSLWMKQDSTFFQRAELLTLHDPSFYIQCDIKKPLNTVTAYQDYYRVWLTAGWLPRVWTRLRPRQTLSQRSFHLVLFTCQHVSLFSSSFFSPIITEPMDVRKKDVSLHIQKQKFKYSFVHVSFQKCEPEQQRCSQRLSQSERCWGLNSGLCYNPSELSRLIYDVVQMCEQETSLKVADGCSSPVIFRVALLGMNRFFYYNGRTTEAFSLETRNKII